MSSQHFEIENYGDFAEVRDKGSTNGTWLNNSRITQHVLKSGDQLRAGTTVFSVDLEGKLSESLDPSTRSSSALAGEDSNQPGLIAPKSASLRVSSRTSGEHSSHEAPSEPTTSPAARLNPFSDSINVESLEVNPPLSSSPLETQSRSNLDQGRRLSPFSDSILLPIGEPEERQPSLSSHQSEREPFDFLAKRLEGPAKEAWIITGDHLSRIYSVMPVVHPLRIRQSIPESCESTIYLWKALGDAQKLGPIALSWLDFKRNYEQFISRLTSADSLMVFFGSSYEKLAMHLEKMTLLGVQGFSEEGGFLSFSWPSSMVTILQTLGRQRCSALFDESMVGVLFPCPSDERVMLAVGCLGFCQSLKDSGFESISRLNDF